MPATFLAGNAGAVRKSGAGVAGITSWRLPTQVAPVVVTHFLSATGPNGLIHEQIINGGIQTTDIEIEGNFDADTTNSAQVFPIGTVVNVDLLFSKTSQLGYKAIDCLVTDFTPGSQLGNDPSKFQLKCKPLGAYQGPQTNNTTTSTTTPAPS